MSLININATDNDLIANLRKICEELRNANFDQSVSDTGNWAANVAAKMIETAINKHLTNKEKEDGSSGTNS